MSILRRIKIGHTFSQLLIHAVWSTKNKDNVQLQQATTAILKSHKKTNRDDMFIEKWI